MAGKAWTQGFMKRHSQIGLRCPEATSMSLVAEFNRIQVGRFFELLQQQLLKQNYSAGQIYNIDESGVTRFQRPGRILAQMDCNQVERIVGAERGETTTVVCAINVGG